MTRTVVRVMAVVFLAVGACTACTGSGSDDACGVTTPAGPPMSAEEADKRC